MSSTYTKAGKAKGIYTRKNSEGRDSLHICYTAKGKQKWETVGYRDEGATVADAVDLRQERVNGVKNGVIKGSGLTLDQGYDLYEKVQASDQKHIKQDTYKYKKWLKDRFGHRKMSDITAMDLTELKSDLAEDDRSLATINHYLGLVNRIFKIAIEHKVYAGPIPQTKRFTVENERSRILYHNEVKTLLDKLKEEHIGAYIHAAIAVFAGLRSGEILKLQGRDVDLKRRVLSVRKQLIRTKGKSRMIPICDELFKILKRYPMKDNQRVIPGYFRNVIQRAMDDLGFNKNKEPKDHDKATPHTFRHTYVSWLIDQNIPLRQVMKWTGHRTIKSLERYTKVPQHDELAIINKMSENYQNQTLTI